MQILLLLNLKLSYISVLIIETLYHDSKTVIW